MEPGETHVNVEVPCPQTYVVLRIAPETLAGAAVELGVRPSPHFNLHVSHEPTILRSFTLLAQRVADDEAPLELQSHFAHCMHQLFAHCIERPRVGRPEAAAAGSAVVNRCKAYLREYYDHAVSLDDLAKLSGMSRLHLLRSFRHLVGVPPHAYQIQLRVERALRVPPERYAPASGRLHRRLFRPEPPDPAFPKVMFITPSAYQTARH